MGVAVRALGRAVAQLGLDGLDRVPARDGLRGNGVASDLVMPELAKPERLLDGQEHLGVCVDLLWIGPVLAEQELVAREVIDSLTAENVFEAPIVTQVDRMHTFWPAEDSHQKFFAQSPGQPYCVFVIAPKVAKLREQFAHRLKS